MKLFTKKFTKPFFPSQQKFFTTSQQETGQQQEVHPVQNLKPYQEALQAATEQNYPQSLLKLKETISMLHKEVSKNTPLQLFVFERMASIYRLQGEVKQLEECFQECVQVSKEAYKGKDRINFVPWELNMLNFYLDYDVYKAQDYGNGLLEDSEFMETAPENKRHETQFATLTAQALHGQDPEHCLKQFQEFQTKLPENSPISPFFYNNLGMANYFQFLDKSAELKDPTKDVEKLQAISNFPSMTYFQPFIQETAFPAQRNQFYFSKTLNFPNLKTQRTASWRQLKKKRGN